MKTKFKKAFTVVELVIVIAVIAVLAAVLIPTFVNIVNRANESADVQLVSNLNKTLAVEETMNGKPASMQEALDAVAENGYVIEKMTPTSMGDILYDIDSNRFMLVNESGVVYKDESTTNINGASVWKIVDSAEDLSTTYSSYFKEGTVVSDTITTTMGIDVSAVKDPVQIHYVRSAEDAAQSAVINGNGGSLTVDAPNDTVYSFGVKSTVNINKIADKSYHEYGMVGEISLAKGRVVAESGSNINTLRVTASSTADVQVEVMEQSMVSAIAATNSSVAQNLGNVVKLPGSSSTTLISVAVSTSLPPYAASGFGTKDSPYVWMGAGINSEYISNKKNLSDWIAEGAKGKELYIKLGSNISGGNKGKNYPLSIKSGSVIIDLAGYTLDVTCKQAVFYVKDGANLTLEDSVGTGTVLFRSTQTSNKGNCGIVYVYNGSATINGGTYEVVSVNADRVGPVAAVTISSISSKNQQTVVINGGSFKTCVCGDNSGNVCIFANSPNAESKITIYDGTFETVGAYDKTHFVLNAQDKTVGAIIVCGGTYKSYMPADKATGEADNIYVEEGYKVVDNGDYTYSVVKAL